MWHLLRSLILTILLPGGLAAGETAVGWRGDGSGIFADQQIPTTWSDTQNILWKAPLPEWSNSSPIVVGKRVLCLSESTMIPTT